MTSVENITDMFSLSTLKSLKINKWKLKGNIEAEDIFNNIMVDELDLIGLDLSRLRTSTDETWNTDIKKITINKEIYTMNNVRDYFEVLSSGAEIILI